MYKYIYMYTLYIYSYSIHIANMCGVCVRDFFTLKILDHVESVFCSCATPGDARSTLEACFRCNYDPNH